MVYSIISLEMLLILFYFSCLSLKLMTDISTKPETQEIFAVGRSAGNIY